MSRGEYESYLVQVPWEEAVWYRGSSMEKLLPEIKARRPHPHRFLRTFERGPAFQAGQRAVVQQKLFAQMRQQRLAFMQMKKKLGRKTFAERRRQRDAFMQMKELSEAIERMGGRQNTVPQRRAMNFAQRQQQQHAFQVMKTATKKGQKGFC